MDALTPEEWKALVDQHATAVGNGTASGHGALEHAQIAVEWGLTDELGPEFTPQKDELALGTRVRCAEGEGVIVRFADQYEITRTGPDSFDEVLHRRHVVQLDRDGSLRAEARADLTVL